MSARHAAPPLRLALPILALLALAPASARALDLVAPRDGGVILGAHAPVEVAGASAPPQVTLDGRALVVTWSPAGRERWFADVPVSAPGAHLLEVTSGRARAQARFRSHLTTSLVAGDLVLARTLATKRPDDLAWGWGPAVLLYGVQRFAPEAAQAAQAQAFLRDYHAHHAARGLPRLDHPDRCPPALTALGLLRDQGDRTGEASAAAVADYLRRERRNALGAIDHLGSRSALRRAAAASAVLGLFTRRWADSVWLDSLFMYALFAAQWGDHTGDVALRDFGLAQPGLFARVLQEPQSGLLRHAWDVRRQRPMGERWLRGDGWVAAAIVDLLDVAPAGDPRRAELEAVLRPLLQGLLDAQDAAGLWPTLLDDPSSYQESSGSALAAYALAKAARQGVTPATTHDPRARARATLRSLTARLRARPAGMSVTGTSVATNAWPAAFWYRWTPRRDDVDWGVGAYLLLAHELRGQRWDAP